MHPLRSLFLLLVGLVLALPLSAATEGSGSDGGASPRRTEPGRVIVLGMDGVDAGWIAQWMDEGLLPNFARLRDQGTFAPLVPGNPAQSPVSWATLNTGRNPGKHGVFDFVRNQRINGQPTPNVGFQEQTRIPTADCGLPLADPKVPYFFYGGGVLLGLVLFLLFRRRILVALIGLAVPVAVGFWLGGSLSHAFPQDGFKDWNTLVKADPWWVELDRAGVPFRGEGTIVDYPARELQHGQLIAGLGAPDAKGGLNSWGIYSTLDERVRSRKTVEPLPAYDENDAPDPGTRSGASAGSGKIFRLERGDDGLLHSKVFGPRNLVREERVHARLEELREQRRKDPTAHAEEYAALSKLVRNPSLMDTDVPMTVDWQPGAKSAKVAIAGQSQDIPLGSWSGFYKFRFVWNRWLHTSAMARVWAEADGDGLELYLSPLQIDPRDPTPGSRICWPRDFAAQLADRIGDFETLGWACQTHAVKDAQLSDAAFLADIEFTYDWRIKMLKDALESKDWQVLFHFFGSPDRICHMMMRHIDPKHPQFVEALADEEYSFFGKQVRARDTARAIYQQMDRAVGLVLDHMRPEDTLLIVSDHGFDSFRRQVSLNNWLAAEGFLKIRNVSPLGLPMTRKQVGSQMLRYVDWAHTQAYSLAIGKIYLNRVGREAQGIVGDADAADVVTKIEKRLYEMKDPDYGNQVVSKVYRREDIYSGPYWQESPTNSEGAAELTIDFVPGYRAAWTTTSGGIRLVDQENADGQLQAENGPFIYDNTSPWSGDHCGVQMSSVLGIFFCSRPLALPEGDTAYDATHLGPTVLALEGVPIPSDFDRKPLLPKKR